MSSAYLLKSAPVLDLRLLTRQATAVLQLLLRLAASLRLQCRATSLSALLPINQHPRLMLRLIRAHKAHLQTRQDPAMLSLFRLAVNLLRLPRCRPSSLLALLLINLHPLPINLHPRLISLHPRLINLHPRLMPQLIRAHKARLMPLP